MICSLIYGDPRRLKPGDHVWCFMLSVTRLSLAWRGNCQRKPRWLTPRTGASGRKAWWRSAPWMGDVALAARPLAASRAHREREEMKKGRISAICEGSVWEKQHRPLSLWTFAICSHPCCTFLISNEGKTGAGGDIYMYHIFINQHDKVKMAPDVLKGKTIYFSFTKSDRFIITGLK